MAQPISTQITITSADGTKAAFDLKNITAAEGAKLYAALGTVKSATNYQAEADKMAAIAKSFQTLLRADVPKDMSVDEAYSQYVEALRVGGGKLSAGVSEGMKKFEASPMGETIVKSGLWKSANTLPDFISGIGKISSGISGTVDTAAVGRNELAEFIKKIITSPMSDASAKAIGAVSAATIYWQSEAPGGLGEQRRREPELLDKAAAGFDYVYNNASTAITQAQDTATTWLRTTFNLSQDTEVQIIKWLKVGKALLSMAGDILSLNIANLKFPDLNAIEQQARTDVAASRSGAKREYAYKGYNEILADRVSSSVVAEARPKAAELLAQLGKVDGYDVTQLAALYANGGEYRNRLGHINTLKIDGGKLTETSQNNDKNQPSTGWDRFAESAGSTVSAITPQNSTQANGLALGAAAVGGLAYAGRNIPGHVLTGAKNLSDNLAAGVNEATGAGNTIAAQTRFGAATQWLGRSATRLFGGTAALTEFGRAGASAITDDKVGTLAHSASTMAIAAPILLNGMKAGGGAAAGIAVPAMEASQTVVDIANGDYIAAQRRIMKLNVIAAAATAGGAIGAGGAVVVGAGTLGAGLLGLAPATAGGVATGALVGSLIADPLVNLYVWLRPNSFNPFVGSAHAAPATETPQKAVEKPSPSTTPDAGLAAAAIDATTRAEAERAAKVFVNSKITLGAANAAPDGKPLPSAAAKDELPILGYALQ